MEEVDLAAWHNRFSPEYDPKLIFQDCADRESALFSWSLFLLFQSVPLIDQPFRKKTGRFFINFQKKFFKTKYNQNITEERDTLAYSLLLIIIEFLSKEKLSKNDIQLLLVYAISHYAMILGNTNEERIDTINHVGTIFIKNYSLIKSKSQAARYKLLKSLYNSFELNINNEKKNKDNFQLLTLSVTQTSRDINVFALNEYRKVMKAIKKYSK